MNWQILGASVIGSSHLRALKPNQDAWGYVQTDTATVLAVADGHGSRKHYYSEQGSKLAVQVTLALLEEFATQVFDVRQVKLASDYLPRTVVQAWRAAVDDLDAGKSPDSERYLLYGTTLLAVLITAEYALYLQIGDGDLVVVDTEGHVGQPLSKNLEFIANETFSLCEERAAYHFELSVRFFLDCSPPALIFLATDGYANSFANQDDFYQAVLDFQTQLTKHGVEKVQSCLEDWLGETSEQGSGDDVTVAIVMQPGSVQASLAVPKDDN